METFNDFGQSFTALIIIKGHELEVKGFYLYEEDFGISLQDGSGEDIDHIFGKKRAEDIKQQIWKKITEPRETLAELDQMDDLCLKY